MAELSALDAINKQFGLGGIPAPTSVETPVGSSLDKINQQFGLSTAPAASQPSQPAATVSVPSAPESVPGITETRAVPFQEQQKPVPAGEVQIPAPAKAPVVPEEFAPLPPKSTGPSLAGEVAIGAKESLGDLAARWASWVDPTSFMSGMGVDPNTPEAQAMAANVPETRLERLATARKAMTAGLFPEGEPAPPENLGRAVLRGVGGAPVALTELAMLAPLAGPAPAIARGAATFALQGLTGEKPIEGALHGAALGAVLGINHQLAGKIANPVYQWLAKIGGGAAIGGGASAISGGGPQEIARDAIIFGLFEVMGMRRRPEPVDAFGQRVKTADKIDWDWMEKNGVPKETVETLKTKPVESPEFVQAVDNASKVIVDQYGRPALSTPTELDVALSKEPFERNAQEKFLADQAARDARERLQPTAAGATPEIIPGEPAYRERANVEELPVDRLQRAVDVVGDTNAGKKLGDLLTGNQDTLANAFRAPGDTRGIPEITDKITELSYKLEDTGDPKVAKELHDYINSNLGALKGLPRWPVGEAPPAPMASTGHTTESVTTEAPSATVAAPSPRADIVTTPGNAVNPAGRSNTTPPPPEAAPAEPRVPSPPPEPPSSAPAQAGGGGTVGLSATPAGEKPKAGVTPPEATTPPSTMGQSGSAAENAGRVKVEVREAPTLTPPPGEIVQPAASGEVGLETQAGRGVGETETPDIAAAKEFQTKFGSRQGAPDILSPAAKKAGKGADFQRAIERNDLAALLHNLGGISPESVRDYISTPEERQALGRMILKKGGIPLDVMFTEAKAHFPDQFGHFEDAGDMVRYFVDGRHKRALNKGSLEKQIEEHDAKIEDEAYRRGVSPERLAGLEADVAREIAAERDAARDEFINFKPDLTESAFGLRSGPQKPTALTARLDALQADYPGIDREKAATVIRALPNAEDGQIANMAADPEMFAQVARGNLKASEKAQLLKKATDAGAQIGLPGMSDAGGLFGTEPSGKKYSVQAARQLAPTFYSQMTVHLEDKLPGKGTGADLAKLIEGWGAKGQVKSEELKQSGIIPWLQEQKGPVTKQQILDKLKEGEVQVRVVEKRDFLTEDESPAGEGPFPGATKFQSYLTDLPESFTNRREMLLTVPKTTGPLDVEGFTKWAERVGFSKGQIEVELENPAELYDEYLTKHGKGVAAAYRVPSSHAYGDPAADVNRFAHLFTADYVDPVTGKKSLVITETQSDWARTGRSKGYSDSAKLKALIDELYNTPTDSPRRAEIIAELDRWASTVPPLPFAKNWHEVALKQAIRFAAENGYDGVMVVNGDMVKQRYDLSKKVSAIEYLKRQSGNYLITAQKHDGNTIDIGDSIPADKLENYVGKDVAKKIIAGGDSGKLTGGDLQVGGEWANNLYDKTIPSFLKKYLKQWGVEVGRKDVGVKSAEEDILREVFKEPADKHGDIQSLTSFDIPPSMKESVLYKGQPRYRLADLTVEERLAAFQESPLWESLTMGQKADIMSGGEGGTVHPGIIRFFQEMTAPGMGKHFTQPEQQALYPPGYLERVKMYKAMDWPMDTAAEIKQVLKTVLENRSGWTAEDVKKMYGGGVKVEQLPSGDVVATFPAGLKGEFKKTGEIEIAPEDIATLKKDYGFTDEQILTKQIAGQYYKIDAGFAVDIVTGVPRQLFTLAHEGAGHPIFDIWATPREKKAMFKRWQDKVVEDWKKENPGSKLSDAEIAGMTEERIANELAREQRELIESGGKIGDPTARNIWQRMVAFLRNYLDRIFPSWESVVRQMKSGDIYQRTPENWIPEELAPGKFRVTEPEDRRFDPTRLDPNGLIRTNALKPLRHLGDVIEGAQSAIVPGAVSKEHQAAAHVLRPHLGEFNQEGYKTVSKMKSDRRMIDKMGIAKPGLDLTTTPAWQMASNISMGRPVTPELEPVARKIISENEARAARMQEAEVPLDAFREHYFGMAYTPESRRAFNQAVTEAVEAGRGTEATEGNVGGQVMNLNDWSTPDKTWVKNRVAELMASGEGSDISAAGYLVKRPMQGRESFRKQKVFDDVMTGMEFGLVPIDPNPVNVFLLKALEMDRSIYFHGAIKDFKAKGDVEFLHTTKAVPEGWRKLEGPYGEVRGPYDPDTGARPVYGNWIAKEPVAELINNSMAQSLYNNPYYGKAFKWFMAVGNLLNQFQLMSGFHIGFTTLETQISHGAMLVQDIFGAARGKIPWSQVGKTLKTYPTAISKFATDGNKILAAYANPGIDVPTDVPVGSMPTNPEYRIALVAKAAQEAGGGFTMEHQFRTHWQDKMIREWYSGQKLKAALRSPVVLSEMAMKPIMDYLVPRQKAAVFSELVGRITEQNPTKTIEQLRPQLNEAWNWVDGVLGQVRYDRIFMRDGAKNAMQALFRAPGWTGGTIERVGGAPVDVVRFIKEWAETGKAPDKLPDRVAYTISLVGTMAIANGLMTYLFTGERPKDMDWWAFRTGEIDSKGRPVRFLFPSYMKDLFAWYEAPGHTAVAKTHPLWSMIGELARNKDYYNTLIRDPQSSQGQQIMDMGQYVLKQYIPFGIRGTQQVAEYAKFSEEPGRFIAPQFGIMPAPRAYTSSPAAQVIEEYNTMMRSAYSTKETAAAKELKRDLRKLAKDQDESGFLDAATKAVEEGRITRQQVKEIINESQAPPGMARFTRMPLEWKVRAWDAATEAEQEQWKPYFLKSIGNEKPENLIKNREPVVEALRKMGADTAADAIANLQMPEGPLGALDLTGLGIQKEPPQMSGMKEVDDAIAEVLGKKFEDKKKKGFGLPRLSLTTRKKQNQYEALGF